MPHTNDCYSNTASVRSPMDNNGFSPDDIHTVDTMYGFIDQFLLVTKEEQITLVNELLISHASQHYNLALPADYLQLSLNALKHLENVGCCNVLFELAKGLGTMRLDGYDSLFPISRMPMGLLHYMVCFFTNDPGRNVSDLVFRLFIVTTIFSLVDVPR